MKIDANTFSPNKARENALYRVSVRVPLELISQVRRMYQAIDPRSPSIESGQKLLLREVKKRVENLGFNNTLLVTQDPTDNGLFSVLTRYQNGTVLNDRSDVRITKVVPVEEPPVVPDTNIMPLDPGLDQDEAWMVRNSLMYDRNPRHLNGVARSLEPWFPVSSTVLRAKARLIEKRNVMGPKEANEILKESLNAIANAADITTKKQAFEQYALTQPTPKESLVDDVKRAALQIANYDLPSDSPLRAFAKPIMDLAKTLVTESPNGYRLVNPNAVKVALPADGTEGFVSPSALQLTLGSQKPAWSGISNKYRVAGILRRLQPDSLRGLSFVDRIKVLKAQNQMERADKAIQRRRWVEWYRRSDKQQREQADFKPTALFYRPSGPRTLYANVMQDKLEAGDKS